MLNNGYDTRKSLSAKEDLKFQVSHHRKCFNESLDILNSKLELLIDHAYSGNVIETIRAAKSFKMESEHLTNSIDHLLITIENLAEPDHGGE